MLKNEFIFAQNLQVFLPKLWLHYFCQTDIRGPIIMIHNSILKVIIYNIVNYTYIYRKQYKYEIAKKTQGSRFR